MVEKINQSINVSVQGEVVLILSAVYPGVSFGVSVADPVVRLNQTIVSLMCWKASTLPVIVLEVVPADLGIQAINYLESKYKCLNLDFIIVRLSDNDVELSAEFGTGYCELLCIEYFLNKFDVKRVIKVSARYAPYFVQHQLRRFKSSGDDIIAFVCRHRNICCAFIISFPAQLFKDALGEMLLSTRDREGFYLEHSFYSFLYSRYDNRRLRFPFYLKYPLISGSNGRKINFFRQLRMWFVYAFL